ncbi:DUF3291 domain-containing protein [Leucothrix pacifica]|uniref:DUF3291 domain-containing protein n=2 Tax=Leucothrix pacifica TaxID=1247513 RepID=A0A317CBX1_9GAMM|nr:DUF3291 domain-containing protein [Leucothrix pacifica]
MKYQLAQLNLAKFRLPMENPVNADFVNNLDAVNAIAEAHPGYIWRLKGEGNDATDLQAYDDPNIIANLSVWADLESLLDFVYKEEAHKNIMRRRREWFDKMEFFMVLWWVKAGDVPSLQQAIDKLEYLKAHGPSPEAFTFRNDFPPPQTT